MNRTAFDAFERIVCINLPRRPERWRQACAEFERLGIRDRVERVPALEHAEPAVGCAHSHAAAIDAARADGLRNLLVFEDDVWFLEPDAAPAILGSALKDLEAFPDWQLLYLGGRLRQQAIGVGKHLWRSRLWSSHAYAVNGGAFDVVLEGYLKTATPRPPLDVWYCDNLNAFCVAPMLAGQHPGVSDIEGRHLAHKTTRFLRSFQTFAPPS